MGASVYLAHLRHSSVDRGQGQVLTSADTEAFKNGKSELLPSCLRTVQVFNGGFKFLEGRIVFKSSLGDYHYCQTKKPRHLFLPSSLLFFQSLFVSLTISLSLFVRYSKELVGIELPGTNK